MIKKLGLTLFIGIIFLLSSCESTGICTEPVTPKLMIGFSANNSLGNPEDIAPPDSLRIYGTKDGIDIDPSIEKDYIYPDLYQVDDDNLITLTFDVNKDVLTYIFKFEGDIFDTLKINYSRENIYINENCGYKTIFNQVELDYYSRNIIDTVILLTENIEYDTEQHIEIFNQ